MGRYTIPGIGGLGGGRGVVVGLGRVEQEMCGKGRECICISGNHRSMVATDAAGNLHLSHLSAAQLPRSSKSFTRTTSGRGRGGIRHS